MANPEDKQMKMQWITVDGRTVPLVLPQIWDPDKEDWVVTSTENPLQVDAQLTGSSVEILVYDAVAFTSTGISGSHTSIDLSRFSRFSIVYQNSHDGDLKLRFLYNGGFLFDNNDSPRQISFIGQSTRNYSISYQTIQDSFSTPFPQDVQMVIQRDVAPTEGALTLKVIGQY